MCYLPAGYILQKKYDDARVLYVVRTKVPLFVQKLPILTCFVPTGASIQFAVVCFVFGQCSIGIGFVVFV